MTSVSTHEAPSNGRSVIGEKHQSSVLGLGDIGEEVEPGIVVDGAALGVALLRANIVGAHKRVSDEEDRPIETNEIVVA